jgi:putative resolvase
MKSKEVLNLLRISRETLTRYVKNGTLRVIVLPNGYYNYNEEDVYKILNKDVKRKTVIYSRVSTHKQKKDLENQIEFLKSWCFTNGLQLNAIYSDIASGISFDKRKDFFVMLDEIIDHKMNK